MYNTGDHYDHTHGTYFILLASIIITLTTQLFIYNLIHQTNISFSLPRALPLGHLGLSRRQRARACNFLRAANPAPDTEEEEELEQWRRPHRRTDGPTPPPTPLHCCPPFFFGPSGQKAKAAAAAEEEEEARRTATRCAIGESRWHAPFRETRERVPVLRANKRRAGETHRMRRGLRDIC